MTDVDMMELTTVTEAFVYGVGRIDNMGAVARIVFYAPSKSDGRYVNEKIISLIVPTDQLAKMAAALLQPVGPPITEQAMIDAKAVVLDLVNPIGSGRRHGGRGGQARLDEPDRWARTHAVQHGAIDSAASAACHGLGRLLTGPLFSLPAAAGPAHRRGIGRLAPHAPRHGALPAVCQGLLFTGWSCRM
jgi:hypothetical protein